MDGILNINKPQGKTSFSVVAMVRRLSGERHVGHAGTLDPEATGVLPVCLGQGTRVIEFLMNTTKVYQAEIELGVATDTYDREFSLGLASNDRELLYELDDAMKKIEEGTFGICEECKSVISQTRLKAVPYARLCVKCQEKKEKR